MPDDTGEIRARDERLNDLFEAVRPWQSYAPEMHVTSQGEWLSVSRVENARVRAWFGITGDELVYEGEPIGPADDPSSACLVIVRIMQGLSR